MKCLKCGEGEIRVIIITGGDDGRLLICDECGMLFRFENVSDINSALVLEDVKKHEMFWKSILSGYSKEAFLIRLKHRVPTLENFRKGTRRKG